MSGLFKFNNGVFIASTGNAVGKKEHEGPLGSLFDIYSEDDRFGMDTWEHAEGESQKISLNMAMKKGNIRDSDIDLVFSGDLINQCTPSYLGLSCINVSKIGIYGACSTAALGMGLCGVMIDSGFCQKCAAVTSSHNLSAERQFRYPIEYGGLQTPTSQWTVTASAAYILQGGEGMARISEFLIGKVADGGVTDANNMGAAMAVAAFDTLWRYFEESGKKPGDFDKIITGDLGEQGYEILLELFSRHNVNLAPYLTDCGLLIYDRKEQKTNAGGSGCGCSAAVMSAHFLKEIEKGSLNNILFLGTGALLSQMSVAQGDSIPGIAHLVRIEGKK